MKKLFNIKNTDLRFFLNIITSLIESLFNTFICKVILIDYFELSNQTHLYLTLIFLLSFFSILSVIMIKKNIETLFRITNLILIIIIISGLFIFHNYVMIYNEETSISESQSKIVIKGINHTNIALQIKNNMNIYDDRELYLQVKKEYPYSNVWKDSYIVDNIILGLTVLFFIGFFSSVTFGYKLYIFKRSGTN